MSNGSSIEFVEQCVHLGTKVYSDIFKKNIDSATNDLYMRTNMLTFRMHRVVHYQ